MQNIIAMMMIMTELTENSKPVSAPPHVNFYSKLQKDRKTQTLYPTSAASITAQARFADQTVDV